MQQQELNRVRLDEMRGAAVYDEQGEKIGKVEEIFYDQQTNIPEWIGIGTGFFGTKRVLVPVQGAQVLDDALLVAYPKRQVSESPDLDGRWCSGRARARRSGRYPLRGGVRGRQARRRGRQSPPAEVGGDGAGGA
jgi:sporulation protein YlmC with PRC-barrel domain